ncbi:MAG TPA: DNA translocase FtsK [Treponemataceae bacterium]|nr:DNA translocase FtsK [Treponemataceae bacterium]
MKRDDRIMCTIGIILLGFAAFFTVGLMMQFLYFGTIANSFFISAYAIGTILYSVYGYSAVLIPVYLLVGAVLSFSPHWTKRKGIYFLCSTIPFFTISLVERLCKMVFVDNTMTVVLLGTSAFLLLSVLLVAIEYLIMAYVADIIEAKDSRKTKTSRDAHYAKEENLAIKKEPTYVDEENLAIQKETTYVEEVNNESTEEIFADLAKVPEETIASAEKALAEEEKREEVDILDLVDEKENRETNRIEPEKNIIKTEKMEAPEDDAEMLVPIGEESKLSYGDLEVVKEEPIKVVFNKPTDIHFDHLYSPKEAEFLSDPFDEMKEDDDDEDAIDFDELDADDEDAIDFDELDDDDEDAIDFDELDDDDEDAIDFDELDDDDKTIVNLEYNDGIQTFTIETTEPLKPIKKNNSIKSYYIPVENVLEEYNEGEYWLIDEKTKQAAIALKETLKEFKIEAEITGIRKGPVITMFEILPASGVRLNKISGLADNIALSLAAQSVRIVAPIPGKQAVGVEIPNDERAIVGFREIISADLPQYKKMSLPVVLGKKINGDAEIIDLAKTPHILIAGATGSGKSVCVNSMILSLLYNRAPSEVRMILIDPKIVELKLYNDIPHLLTPVITEPKKAFQALQYALCEMERRYALLDGMGVRDIGSYNKRIKKRKIATENIPYIVIIIDEFADLMATTGKELESTIARLAAMSRAVGIHLVLATQRPSIDVITGLIKANIPSRIAFMVASKTDSRIIIDQIGAEKLLGKGDMLYTSTTDPFPTRIQGTFVSDDEVENVVDYVKQFGPPDYIDDEIFFDEEDDDSPFSRINDSEDPLYDDAVEIVMQAGKASASYIQRRLKVGYNRAARLVEQMEDEKIVGPPNGSKPREVLRAI